MRTYLFILFCATAAVSIQGQRIITGLSLGTNLFQSVDLNTNLVQPYTTYAVYYVYDDKRVQTRWLSGYMYSPYLGLEINRLALTAELLSHRMKYKNSLFYPSFGAFNNGVLSTGGGERNFSVKIDEIRLLLYLSYYLQPRNKPFFVSLGAGMHKTTKVDDPFPSTLSTDAPNNFYLSALGGENELYGTLYNYKPYWTIMLALGKKTKKGSWTLRYHLPIAHEQRDIQAKNHTINLIYSREVSFRKLKKGRFVFRPDKQ